MRKQLWSGTIEIGDRWAGWTGAVGDNDIHRHFSAQAILADTPVTVLNATGRPVASRFILIDPLVPHRVASGVEAQLIFVEPPFQPHEVGRRLRPWIEDGAPTIITGNGPSYWEEWNDAGPSRPAANDPRIVTALARIEEKLSYGSLRLSDIASASGLSPSRFRHLFAVEMRTPFRRYVLWRRLVRAAGMLRQQAGVTEAAHEAGFADAAHFARVLKSAFGINATQALTKGL